MFSVNEQYEIDFCNLKTAFLVHFAVTSLDFKLRLHATLRIVTTKVAFSRPSYLQKFKSRNSCNSFIISSTFRVQFFIATLNL